MKGSEGLVSWSPRKEYLRWGRGNQAYLHLKNDGTHMGGLSAILVGITLTLLVLLITHHSAPHKKVTVVKDGHAFAQDLMNWRSRALAAPDAPQSNGDGSGKERC